MSKGGECQTIDSEARSRTARRRGWVPAGHIARWHGQARAAASSPQAASHNVRVAPSHGIMSRARWHTDRGCVPRREHFCPWFE